MNVTLHPCDQHHPERVYYASTAFELDSWVNVLKDITAVARPIDKPVAVHWTTGDFEERSAPGTLYSLSDFDPDCTWLVEAWVIKALNFGAHADWHSDRLARLAAIQAYFTALSDDWPVIVHYV